MVIQDLYNIDEIECVILEKTIWR